MKRSPTAFVLSAFVLSLSASLAAVQSVVGPDTVKNQGGAVTVEAKYLDAGPAGAGTPIRFEIKLDTHSVNLDQYDLKQLATLRNDRGVAVKPLSFEKEGSGHHVQHVLAFPATDGSGNSVVGAGATAVELVLTEIANVPQRVLRWEVQ